MQLSPARTARCLVLMSSTCFCQSSWNRRENPMTLRVDDKVVCVMPHHGWARPYGEAVPKRHGIYTVREVVRMKQGLIVRLVEIVNPAHAYCEGVGECGFPAAAFRKAVKRQTDISVFTRLLPSEKKVLQPA